MEEENQENKEKEELDDEKYFRIVKPLKTYESDTAELLRDKGASQIDIRLEEEKRKRRKEKSTPKQETHQKAESTYESYSFRKLIIAFVVLVISVTATLGISKFFQNDIEKELAERPSLKPEVLIKGDIIKNIDVTKKGRVEILKTIYDASQDLSINQDQVIVFYPVEVDKENNTEKAMGAELFMSIMTEKSPGYLLRSFGPKMTTGFYALNEFEPFIILEINSKANAFAGMIDWEKNMAGDLSGFIVKNDTSDRSFEDRLIDGKDLRVLKNSKGETIIVYSFIDEKTLIITGNLEVFTRILNKISDSQ